MKIQINIPRWNIAETMGYQPKTTFWEDFSIAERFGEKAVRDTFKRAFDGWKTDHVYLTELVMVLNHKLWAHYDKENFDLAGVYDELWKKADEYAANNLKGEELNYFYSVTD